MKKRKNIFNLLQILIILFLFSCSKKNLYDWTIVVYMAADNSLSSNAVSDINEMETAIFNEQRIKIVLLSDLLNLPDEERLYEDSRRFDIHHDDNLEKITSPVFAYEGEYNSGDYHTLVVFANWAYKKYPAIHKALFIWSHGNGWYSYSNKFCLDHSSFQFFNIPQGDLKKAFQEINYPIDIVGLDACNMGTVEIFNELDNGKIGYIISSESEIKSDGFPYDMIFSNWENYSDDKILAYNIGKLLFDSYEPGGSQNPFSEMFSHSASVISLYNYRKLKDDIKNFLNMDLNNISTEIKEARDACYNDLDIDYSSQIDIMQFFTFLSENLKDKKDYYTIVEKIKEDISNSFIYHNASLLPPNIGYASVWFPTLLSTYENMKNDYIKLNFSSEGWDKILKIYFSDVDKKVSKNLVKR